MEFKAHTVHNLTDRSYQSLVRKEIKKQAEAIGFSGSDLGKIEIIIAELTSNLIKHTTQGGALLVKAVYKNDAAGIEIIAVDRGPGMADAGRMMTDGISTTQTLGQGLGAIQRLSHNFDLYSQPGWGTVVLSRYYLKPNERTPQQRHFPACSTVMVPKNGEIACGDGWATCEREGYRLLLAVDGLGHGPDAEAAAQAAIHFFLESSSVSPVEIIAEMHVGIRKTRGVVGVVFAQAKNTQQLSFCGVGNISARMYGLSTSKAFNSYNGIIGMNKPTTMHDQEVKLEGQQLLILASDGIKSRWDLHKLPNLYKYDCSTIAAALYSEYSRRTDDTLVLAARLSK